MPERFVVIFMVLTLIFCNTTSGFADEPTRTPLNQVEVSLLQATDNEATNTLIAGQDAYWRQALLIALVAAAAGLLLLILVAQSLP